MSDPPDAGEFDEWKPDGASWDDASELWEHQGQHLTVGELVLSLQRVDPSLPVTIELHEPGGDRAVCRALVMSYVGTGQRPDGLVLTVMRR